MRPTLGRFGNPPQPLPLLKLDYILSSLQPAQADSTLAMLSAARSSLRATRTGALRFPRLEPLVRFQSTGASRPDYTSILVSQPAEGVSQITLNRPKALNGSSTSSARDEEERAFHLTRPTSRTQRSTRPYSTSSTLPSAPSRPTTRSDASS